MRIQIVTLLSTFVLAGCVGTRVETNDKGSAENELDKFQGTWMFESLETGGNKQLAADLQGFTVTFRGGNYTVKKGDEVIQTCTMKLDPSKSPKTLDSTVVDGVNKGTLILGIYQINDDTLKVCFDPEGKQRPTEFKAVSGSQTLVVHKRLKK